FIRFAQWRIEKTGYGILAFVTNHGYLDNPTFRGMRQSLMETFDEIYVLDLHGNAKKKERCPDDSKDENVFDIQQGVAISIFVKRLNGKKEVAKVYHAHLWGIREIYKETPDGRCLVGGKYHWLRENDVTTTGWNKLKPQSPFYLFVPQDNDLLAEYEQGWKVTEAMPVNVLGFQTHRDHFAIDFSKSELYKRIEEMCDESISNQEYAEKYDLKDNRDWKLNEARRAIRREAEWQNKLTSCLYRPFDRRSCYFSTVAMDYPRRELINHVAGKNNLVLNLPRIVKLEEWQHALIADVPCTAISMDINGSYVFPLYLYEEQLQANFSQDFLNDITKKLDHTPSPEAIFYYIYAILYSPTYRTRYAEFLKIDFPRVPLTSSDELFRQ
ncbi:DNA methyltransferase, partial [Chroococcidiopsidales cyanobacterium LEGE 13417]|nr:DNA methyltransferase [Chroococcidiopsidales cyanobacterium LEGE 13417]